MPASADRPLRRARPPTAARPQRRRNRGAAVGLAQQIARRALVLTGHARQPLDQRAELVLAEEPQDLLPVVVAEPRRLEVELDRAGPARTVTSSRHWKTSSRCSTSFRRSFSGWTVSMLA